MSMRFHIDKLTFGYPGRPLGRIEGLTLESGRIHYLIGGNGVGKSTLMKTLAGTISPLSSSVVVLDDDPLPIEDRRAMAGIVSYMHSEVVSARLSISEFLRIGLSISASSTAENERAYGLALDYCKRLRVPDPEHTRIDRTSDGEYQKVLIILGLARDTPVLLMDEPLSHLDPLAQEEVMELFNSEAQRKVLCMSTHVLEKLRRYPGVQWALMQEGVLQRVDIQGFEELSSLSRIYADKADKNFT